MVLIEKYINKQCTKCTENFPATLDFFHKQKNGAYGLRPTCKDCTNLERRIFHKNNKENDNKTNKKWYQNNKQERTEQIKEYREENPDKIKEWRKDYQPVLNKRRRERRKDDVIFKLRTSISNLIRGSFKRQNIIKTSKSEIILGCSILEFRLYLENQFESWMDWNNYGAYNPLGERTWNLDHIIPIDTAKTVEDVIKLNYYTNMRPLCSKENILKGTKIITY